MLNLEKPFLYLFLLASVGACSSMGGGATRAGEEDEQFADAGVVAEGCPDSLGALGALSEGPAEIFGNAITTHHSLSDNMITLGLYFTRIEGTRELQATTYTLSGAYTANACFESPAPAECAALAIVASNPHQMVLSARSGTITVTRAEVEGLGRVAGSFSSLELAEVDAETGTQFVSGGCSITVGGGTFDDDLTTAGGTPPI